MPKTNILQMSSFGMTTDRATQEQAVHHASVSMATGDAMPRTANSHTNVINVGADTQESTVTTTHHQDSDLRTINTNPLPSCVSSRVNIPIIRALASDFPDKNLYIYIMEGLESGFKTGFSGPISATRPKNLLSSKHNKQKVTSAIIKELHRKHTSGPFLNPPLENLHCSPIGAVDKPDGTIRLVLDLSQPDGKSINEYIDKEESSVQYTHFDEATKIVRQMGHNCFNVQS